MKKLCIWLALLLCLLPLAQALGEADPIAPEMMGDSFHMQDGVIYWLTKNTASAVDFLADAEHITVRAEVLGKPVRCESINFTNGSAKSITVEKGVTGLSYIYIRHNPALETVDIRAVTAFDFDDMGIGSHVYLLDCPNLTSFQVYENALPFNMTWQAESCPKLTVSAPPKIDEVSPYETHDPSRYVFNAKTHPGETTCVVPEGVTDANIESSDVLRIELPSTLDYVYIDAPNLLEIAVANGNQHMQVVNGVLYSYDFATLITYPAGRKDTSYAPHPATEWANIFRNDYLTKIVLPNYFGFFDDDYGISLPNLAEVALPSSFKHEPAYIDLTLDDYYVQAYYDRMYYHQDVWGDSQKEIRITVEAGNQSVTAIDGILYTKDGKELLRVPPTRQGELVLPEGTERIAPFAMRGCVGIDSLVLPTTLQSPQPLGAFYGLDGLKAFRMAGESQHFQVKDGVLFTKDGKTLLVHPALHGTQYTVPQGTQRIAPFAFMPNDMLEDVRMPASVTSIGEWAFIANTALVSINLSPFITEIGDCAFEDCYSIQKLVLPKGLTRVGRLIGFSESQEHSWYDYDHPDRTASVTPIEVWIPGTVTSIGSANPTKTEGFGGRLSNEILLVVEQGSAGHAFAYAQNIPYCFPDQLELARNGFPHILLLGAAGDRVPTYQSSNTGTPGPTYPVGTALLLMGEENGFYMGQFAGQTVYVQREDCRIETKEQKPSWSLWSTQTVRHAAPLYARPSTDDILAPAIPAGTEVDVSATLGPWCHVITPSGAGYMLRRDLFGSNYWYYECSVTLPSISAQAPVYAYPSEDAPVVDTLTDGEDIRIEKATQDGWILMERGYIRMQDVEVRANQ